MGEVGRANWLRDSCTKPVPTGNSPAASSAVMTDPLVTREHRPPSTTP